MQLKSATASDLDALPFLAVWPKAACIGMASVEALKSHAILVSENWLARVISVSNPRQLVLGAAAGDSCGNSQLCNTKPRYP